MSFYNYKSKWESPQLFFKQTKSAILSLQAANAAEDLAIAASHLLTRAGTRVTVRGRARDGKD